MAKTVDENTVKSVYFRAYDDAIAFGKELIADELGNEDLLDLIGEEFTGNPKHFQRVMDNGTFEDCKKVFGAFLDGLEDGIKSGIGNIRRDYERRLHGEFS